MTTKRNMRKDIILVVDDEPTNLDVLYTYLRQANFKVLVAQDGRSALVSAARSHPDVILLDVMMPGLDGFETCRRLKMAETTQDIPVIFMTALSETRNKVRGFDVGAVDYVTKPIHPAEVLARVETQLNLRRLQHKLQDQNTRLEALIQARTAELLSSNAQLKAEIAQREAYFEEREQLLQVLQRQNEHLRSLMDQVFNAQPPASLNTSDEVQHALYESLHTLVTQTSALYQNAQAQRILSWLPDLEKLRVTVLQIQSQIERLVQQLTAQPAHAVPTLDLSVLSPRELEVFHLVGESKSPKDIAEHLNISVKTVYKHRRAVMEKLDIDDPINLLKIALQQS